MEEHVATITALEEEKVKLTKVYFTNKNTVEKWAVHLKINGLRQNTVNWTAHFP